MIAALAAMPLLPAGGQCQEGLRWERSFRVAQKKARAQDKPLLVNFWAEGSHWCRKLDQTTYVDPEVVALSSKFVAVKVDIEGSRAELAVTERYDVMTLPTITFLSPAGHLLLRVGGYQGPGPFPRTMKKALAISQRVRRWERALEKDPKDPTALVKLGSHLFDQDDWEQSQRLLLRARGLDEGHARDERKLLRLRLGMTLSSSRDHAAAIEVLEEGLAFGKDPRLDPSLLYVLGRSYEAWGHTKKAIKIMRHITERHGDSPMAEDAWKALQRLEGESP